LSDSEYSPPPCSAPSQRFREECLADRGYRFLRQDGADMLWQFQGFATTHTVRVKPNGDTEDVPNAAGQGREAYPAPACSAPELTSQPERPLADRYNELLYAVALKFPGESRHETALRYIRQAEEVHAGPCMQNSVLGRSNPPNTGSQP
jgi:hypothetical protein